MTVVNLVLKASFSSTVILMVTFGWAAIYSLANFCQNDRPGSLVEICHQLMVTFWAGACVAAGWAGACVAAGATGAAVGASVAGVLHEVSAKATTSKTLKIM